MPLLVLALPPPPLPAYKIPRPSTNQIGVPVPAVNMKMMPEQDPPVLLILVDMIDVRIPWLLIRWIIVAGGVHCWPALRLADKAASVPKDPLAKPLQAVALLAVKDQPARARLVGALLGPPAGRLHKAAVSVPPLLALLPGPVAFPPTLAFPPTPPVPRLPVPKMSRPTIGPLAGSRRTALRVSRWRRATPCFRPVGRWRSVRPSRRPCFALATRCAVLPTLAPATSSGTLARSCRTRTVAGAVARRQRRPVPLKTRRGRRSSTPPTAAASAALPAS